MVISVIKRQTVFLNFILFGIGSPVVRGNASTLSVSLVLDPYVEATQHCSRAKLLWPSLVFKNFVVSGKHETLLLFVNNFRVAAF